MAKGGSIKKLNSGKWQWIGYYVDNEGKERRPKKTFNTKKEAEAYRDAQYKTKTKLNNLKNKRTYTVEEYFNKWRLETWADEETYSFNTTLKWASNFKVHILPYIGKEKIDCIDYSRFQKHLDDMDAKGYSHKYLFNIVQALKSMLKFADDDKLISINNVNELKIKGRKKDYKIFNVLRENDFNSIYDYMKSKNYYYAEFFMFLHETGIRSEEISISINDVDFDNRIIWIRRFIKTKKDVETGRITKEITLYGKSQSAYRPIPMTKQSERAIKSQLKYKETHNIKSDYIFTSKTGNTVDTGEMLRSWKRAIEKVNKSNEYQIPNCGLHLLRKLFCKNARDGAGLDWINIQRVMGHSDVSITQKVYYSMDIEDFKDLSTALDMANTRLQKERVKSFMEESDEISIYDNTEISVEY